MTDPLVSVLTPSFNQARWLGDNLRSVAAQSHRCVEHVVIDGGSTDGSVDILRSADPAVRWRSEPDRGQSQALNRALGESRGTIIGWLNSDDAYFDADAVAAAVRTFAKHPEVDVVYGHAALVNADGLILQSIWVPPYSYRLLRRFNFIIQPAAFVRRSAIRDFLVDESFDYAMDRELWLRLGQEHRSKRVSRILAIDRHHLGRKSLTRLDLAEVDGRRLADMYGVPAPGRQKWRQKGLTVGMRLAGLSLLTVGREGLAFNGGVDTLRRLAWRQMAVKRKSMPAEGGP